MALTATFDSRDHANMAVERLVHDIGIERTDICVSASDTQSRSAGMVVAMDGRTPDQNVSGNAPRSGGFTVSVDLQDEAKVEVVSAALEECGAQI